MTLPQGLTVAGIDVSHYQGHVAWNAVAAGGISFAFAKATDGAGGYDPMFAANWPAMKAAGVVRGAYHFFRPGDDPLVQKNAFLSTVTLEAGDLPPVLDVEGTPSGPLTPAIVPNLQAWLGAVEAATGVRPILYTNYDTWQNQLGNPRTSLATPLWIARYASSLLALPGGWPQWTFWQYSQSGRVPGVAGPVDLDAFHGTLDDLRALASAPGSLRLGAAGSLVMALQQRLQDLGFDPGPIDGHFGPRTRAPVVAFQTANGLAPDGVVTPAVRAALGLG